MAGTINSVQDAVMHACVGTSNEHSVVTVMRYALRAGGEYTLFAELEGGRSLVHCLAEKHGHYDEFEALLDMMQKSCSKQRWLALINKQDTSNCAAVTSEAVSKPRQRLLRKFGAKAKAPDTFTPFAGAHPNDMLPKLIAVHLVQGVGTLDRGRFDTIAMLMSHPEARSAELNALSVDSEGKTVLHKLVAIRGCESWFLTAFKALKVFVCTRGDSDWKRLIDARDSCGNVALCYAANKKRFMFLESEGCREQPLSV
jgi:hypothetical protein